MSSARGSGAGRASLTRAVDTLVLDLGNVVLGWDPARAFPELSAQEFEAMARRIDFYVLNRRADEGESFADLEAQISAVNPTHAGLLHRYHTSFALTVTPPLPGMVALVEEVRRAGLAIYGLTNWSDETFHHGMAAAPVIETFDGVVVSGREGVAKPEPRLFQVLLERYALAPERCLFVDDSPVNVTAARALGMAGHVFAGADALRAELERLNVLSC